LQDRQEKILYSIVDEYIQTANPVSSGIIFDIEDFGVSCPTIRNEMAKLTELGYLAQPHTSAGRVPTEQGYRFFVDKLVNDYSKNIGKKIERDCKRDTRVDAISRAKEISARTRDAVIFVDEDGELKYIGLKKLFGNPEFKTREAIISLIGELESFENDVGGALAQIHNCKENIEIFIGSENPFFECDDYSMIISPFSHGFISLLGPTRMDYRRNISILEKFL